MDEALRQAYKQYGDAVVNQGSYLHQGDNYISEASKITPAFFRTSNYEAFKDVNPTRVQGTCRWVLTHPHYKIWRENRSGLLWVSADPGCGKSTFAKSLVDEELLNAGIHEDMKLPVLYFFFKDIGRQSLATTALCALLHQLYCSDSNVFQACLAVAKRAVDCEGESLKDNLSKLWLLFLDSVRAAPRAPVTCVLDGLDECEEDQRRALMDRLLKLKDCNQSLPVKFIILSRPYQKIFYDFQPWIDKVPTIHLAGENETWKLATEIDLVIHDKITQLASRMKLSLRIRTRLIEKLSATPQRTYLWLAFILSEIAQLVGPTDRELLQQIDELPVNLESAYERILQKSPRPELARTILLIITIATRPLSLSELELLFKVHASCYRLSDLDLAGPLSFQKAARNICGLFLSVIDSKVYLIHQTAKDFLLRSNAFSAGHYVWRGCVTENAAHAEMAHRCLSALTIQYSDQPAKNLLRAGSSTVSEAFAYPRQRWHYHLRHCSGERGSQSFRSFERFSNHVLTRSERGNPFWEDFPLSDISRFQFPSQYTSEDTKLHRTLRSLLFSVKVGSKSSWFAPTLLCAAVYRIDHVFLTAAHQAKLVLDQLTADDPESTIARRFFVWLFRVTIIEHNIPQIQCLISHYADIVHWQDAYGDLPLHYALPDDKFEVSEALRLLLSAGAQLTKQVHCDKRLARVSDMHLLLNHGLDPFGIYMWNLAILQNKKVLNCLVEDGVLRQRLVDKISSHTVCTWSEHLQNPFTVDASCGSVEDHLQFALLLAMAKEKPLSANALAKILQVLHPENIELCTTCYTFTFCAGTPAFEHALSARTYRYFVHFGTHSALASCKGLGPLMYAATYNQTATAAGFLQRGLLEFQQQESYQNPMITARHWNHVNGAISLRWAAFLAVLHDNTRLLRLIFRYADAQSVRLNLGSRHKHIPSKLIKACTWRHTACIETFPASWTQEPVFSENEDSFASWKYQAELATLLLRWSAGVLTALVRTTHDDILPRFIFDAESLARIRVCTLFGHCTNPFHQLEESINRSKSVDPRFLLLLPHLKATVFHAKFHHHISEHELVTGPVYRATNQSDTTSSLDDDDFSETTGLSTGSDEDDSDESLSSDQEGLPNAMELANPTIQQGATSFSSSTALLSEPQELFAPHPMSSLLLPLSNRREQSMSSLPQNVASSNQCRRGGLDSDPNLSSGTTSRVENELSISKRGLDDDADAYIGNRLPKRTR